MNDQRELVIEELHHEHIVNKKDGETSNDHGGDKIDVQIQMAKVWLLEHAKGITSLSLKHDLSMLTKLDLPNCGLSSLPDSLPQVVPKLSIFFCPKNKFVEVPEVIGRCPNLQMVSFKECHTITTIHAEALQPQMRWLILTGNLIEKIPDTISRCTKLQKLMLSGNKISSMPSLDVLRSLQNLELVRLACNNLTDPPFGLLELSNLKWAAFASNPFLIQAKGSESGDLEASSSSKLHIIDDPTLEDTAWPVLGQGAGGVTRKVSWKTKTKKRKACDSDEDNKDDCETLVVLDVAVKMYAGELTSDGSPQDEKKIATTLATTFPNEPGLIHVYGETKTKGGLVMEFLEGYDALAGPPNFDTCSRDVYDTTSRVLSPSFCWKIATSMLRVLCELHKLGICHGDFYAHNILIRPSSDDVKLSDFGAAFCYSKDGTDDGGYGKYVEQTEMRSYSVLAHELYDNYVVGNVGDDENAKWQALMKECEEDCSTFASLADKFVIAVVDSGI